jgi:hypothetical protein
LTPVPVSVRVPAEIHAAGAPVRGARGVSGENSRLSRNAELEAPRRQPILSAPIRTDTLTLLLLQVACVLIVGAWSALLAYLAWLVL